MFDKTRLMKDLQFNAYFGTLEQKKTQPIYYSGNEQVQCFKGTVFSPLTMCKRGINWPLLQLRLLCRVRLGGVVSLSRHLELDHSSFPVPLQLSLMAEKALIEKFNQFQDVVWVDRVIELANGGHGALALRLICERQLHSERTMAIALTDIRAQVTDLTMPVQRLSGCNTTSEPSSGDQVAPAAPGTPTTPVATSVPDPAIV
jgi:hypothetical protein